MQRLSFYTKDEVRIYDKTFGIYLSINSKYYPTLTEVPLAIFGYEKERDLYFSEFTDQELTLIAQLTDELWNTEVTAEKKSIGSKIERLKNSVQKRTGIVDS